MIYLIKTNLDLNDYYQEHKLKVIENNNYYFISVTDDLVYKLFEAELKFIGDKEKINFTFEKIDVIDSFKNNKILACAAFLCESGTYKLSKCNVYNGMAVLCTDKNNQSALVLSDNIIGEKITDINSICCAGCMATELKTKSMVFIWRHKHEIFKDDKIKIESITLIDNLYNITFKKVFLENYELNKIENYYTGFNNDNMLKFQLFDDERINFENVNSLQDLQTKYFKPSSKLIKSIKKFIKIAFDETKVYYIEHLNFKIKDLERLIFTVKKAKLQLNLNKTIIKKEETQICQNKLI